MRIYPHSKRAALLCAVNDLGPLATNKELSAKIGCDRAVVRAVLSQYRMGGIVDESVTDGVRSLVLTVKGRDLWARIAFERAIRTQTISKPESVHAGEEKPRRCLSCRAEFISTWSGHRICQPCHQLDSQQDACGLPAQWEGSALC